MAQPQVPAPPASAPTEPDETPRHRPEERFWPYADLPEQPDAEELASLDPDLHDALYGVEHRPFSVTVVYPRFEGPAFGRAAELAKEAVEVREVGEGPAYRVRARFLPSQPLELRRLFEVVSAVPGCEVLIDDRPVPFARELWLPLIWFLIPR